MLDIEWFANRKPQPDHHTYLSTINPLLPSEKSIYRPDYQALDDLFQIVFDEQPILFDSAGTFATKASEEKEQAFPAADVEGQQTTPKTRIPDTESLLRHFYCLKLLELPLVKRGLASGAVLGRSPEDAIRQFMDNVFLKNPTHKMAKKRNQVSALVGEVGTGKSLMISYILSSELATNMIKKHNTWFIKLNLQELSTKGFTIENFCQKLVQKTRHIINYFNRYEDFVFIPDEERDLVEAAEKEIFALIDSGDITSAEAKTIEYIKLITSKSKHRPVLILDNADSIFYEHDQINSILIDDVSRYEIIDEYTENIRAFVELLKRLISSTGSWAALDTSILVVLRQDSYNILDQISVTTAGGAERFILPRNVFSLEATNNSSIQRIMLGRLHYLSIGCRILLQEEVEKYCRDYGLQLPISLPKEFRDRKITISELLDALSKSLSFFEKKKLSIANIVHRVQRIHTVSTSIDDLNKSLTNYVSSDGETGTRSTYHAHAISRSVQLSGSGLREAIKNYKPFYWVRNSGQKISTVKENIVGSGGHADRVFRNPNLGTLMQILGRRARYAEKFSFFPNVFLAYDEESHANTPHISYPDYWLIPLILQSLSRLENVPLEHLLKKFCNFPKAGKIDHPFAGFYPLQQVCDTLTRLQRIDGPRLLKIDKEYNANTCKFGYKSVELTGRARQLLSSADIKESSRRPLIEDFLYLQLVIDDPQLPLPIETFTPGYLDFLSKRNIGHNLKELKETSWQSPLPFEYQHEFNYSYIVRENYPERYTKVMGHKLLKLGRFLGMLEAAKEVEKNKYYEVWKNLPGLEDGLFNTGSVLQAMVSDVGRYARDLSDIPTKEKVASEYQRMYEYFSATFPVAYGIEP